MWHAPRLDGLSFRPQYASTNLDLITTFGHMVGGVLEYSVISDGTVDIAFTNIVENPLLNGLEVFCV